MMSLFVKRVSLLSLALAGSFAWSCAQATERNWSYTYNSLGLIETANGPRTDVQDVTTYAYDAQGHLTTVTNALGHITQLSSFDSYGNPQNLIDANGVPTSLTYTLQGWLASASTAGSTTSFEHDAVGLITKVTRGDGSWLSYTWDDARRLTKITNNLGETIEYNLDAMGNRTAQRLKDASSSLTQQQTWVYDELGRLLRSVGAGGQTSGYQYDLNDNPTVSTNPKQHSTTQAYDALDRVVSSTDPLNGVTTLAYNTQDNLTRVKDPRGVTTQYEYDGLGNLTKQISPDSGTTTFSYDPAGNVISKTDARNVVTTYTYDALNRLTGRQYPASPALNVQYHYDMTASGNKGIGRLTAVQDASGVLGYSYDERGNLIGQLRSVALSSGDHYDSLGYAYDGANQLARIDYPQGFSILYPRNAAGQVSQVQLQVGSGQPSGFASSISYMPFGPLKSFTWANGVSLSRTYDQDYRLTQQVVDGWNSTYGYDANSNITTLNSSLLGDLNYSYDALDRLTAEQKVNLQQTYSYDAVGNRAGKTTTPIVNGVAQTSTQQTYQYASTSNRLTKIGTQAVTTDTVGNLTRDRANRELVYDAQNRLTSVKLGGNTVAEFRYNALGQRTHKISAQGTTTFLYGPDGQLLGEQQFNSQGSKLSGQYYIWLDSMPLGGVSITFDAQGAIASSEPFYLHSDHLNTPRMATNQTQQNVWQWQSDAFGVGQASGSLAMNLRFPGQYFDQESGLHHNYFRDYDPETGRYVESDPIGLAGGINTYAYVEGNPMDATDPDGLNRRRGGPPPGPVLINLQVNSLLRQIRSIDPIFSYSTVRLMGPQGRYSLSDISNLQQFLNNAQNAGFCGAGAARAPVMPTGNSQLGHIFRPADGHVNPLTQASQNRFSNLFRSAAGNPANQNNQGARVSPHAVQYGGVSGYIVTYRNGTVWVQVGGNGIVQNAGVNRN